MFLKVKRTFLQSLSRCRAAGAACGTLGALLVGLLGQAHRGPRQGQEEGAPGIAALEREEDDELERTARSVHRGTICVRTEFQRP